MKLLLLGGTAFLGRHLAEAALARGDEITLFNRGKRNPGLFPGVEELYGDRDGGLGALAGRAWDAVIDTSGYVPRLVRASAEALAGSVEHYTFVSSLSVYADFSIAGLDEHAAVGALDDPTIETITAESYGPLKALSEAAAEAALPGRVLTIRPGLIVGPHDASDRFTYWVHRVAAGGTILAPGRPGRQVEFIDVRDLAVWMLRLIDARRTGVYNATGPSNGATMGSLLESCRVVAANDAALVWVDEAFLLDNGVEPWLEMPLWIPESDPSMAGFNTIDCRKALADGLTCRPVGETVRDTLAWDAGRPADHSWRAGVSRARESRLLAAWAAREARESYG